MFYSKRPYSYKRYIRISFRYFACISFAVIAAFILSLLAYYLATH